MKRNHIIFLTIIIALIVGAVMINQETKQSIELVESDFGTSSSKVTKEAQPVLKTQSNTETSGMEKSPESPELDMLPTMNDLKALSEEEVHHTPQIILEGGRIIGQMIERADNNPELREETVKTLQACAESDEIATAIRAVCWKNTLNSIEKWKVFVPVSQSQIPERVIELSSQLP